LRAAMTTFWLATNVAQLRKRAALIQRLQQK
jgi:hypothetical protein